MQWKTNDEIMIELAQRVKKIRKIRKFSQKQLSLCCNVSYGSIKRFETTGEISLKNLLQITDALNIKNEVENLFTGNYYRDISEVI